MNQTTVPIQADGPQGVHKSGIYKLLRKNMWGYLFILPAALIFIAFLWMPIIKGFVYSFQHVDFVNGTEFIGLANYKTVFQNPDVGKAVKNTLYYMLLGLLIGYWIPILFAIAISELKKFQGFARVAAYLPNVLPVVVLYGLWRWFYDPVGPINATLSQAGADQIAFLTDTRWS
ncbi:sugar ABC transporter permease, partial [Paenibacillus sepulcri]|nr:sugar ABC transporter permease [Paenibacillus sepulcri]